MGRYRRNRGNGPCRGNKQSRYIFGILLVVIGGLLFASKAGVFIPTWIFSWPMILIAVGLAIGISHKFRGTGWLWPLAIGAFFLADKAFPQFFPREFFWPVMLVLGGLFLIFRPRHWDNNRAAAVASAILEEDPAASTVNEKLNESSVFGSIRKNILTKNFGGGEVSTVFGSAEINLSQADFDLPPKLELNAVFGSIRLIIPSHWQLKMENNSVLGSVEDQRPKHTIFSDKILYVEANAVFGGIEISNF
ncbi:DUF5668 domain-containing protein [Flavihumibacter sp. CACIAM 22H1]|uniref:LiaF transmembrane domain-containing protein n=1 Tax=Flavihumibacter sp. CACIAM 22H1 TaxID=1812911 RepID=UPI0007A91928|nr:DUF5668 domain-containing protein [Flavihumibacter sp. CACIAM 22H1]KYP16556.1 MAG: hypothetical protein A1D16_09010 [Flavihumibacter sp. CACIAM 22H1]